MLSASSVKFASDKISTPLQRWFFVRRQPLSLPRLLPTTTNPYQEHGAMFYCRYCNQQFLNAQDRDSHVNEKHASPADVRTIHPKENHSDAVKDLARGQCDNMVVHDKERFNLRNYFHGDEKSSETRAHVQHQRSASESRSQSSTAIPSANTNSFTCNYCSQKFGNRDAHCRHLIYVHEAGVMCSYCNHQLVAQPGDLAASGNVFKEHIDQHHKIARHWECIYCGISFNDRQSLMNHHENHQILKCHICRALMPSHAASALHKKFQHKFIEEFGFVGMNRYTYMAPNGRSISKGQPANLASVIAPEANVVDLELPDSTEEITINDDKNESAVSTSTRSTNGETATQKKSVLAQSKKGREQLRQRKTSSSESDDEPAPKEAMSNALKVPRSRQNVFAAGANESKQSTGPTPRSAPKRKTMEEMHNAADMEYVCTLCNQLRSAYQSDIISHLETIHKTRHDICPDFCQLREIPQPEMDEEEEDQRSNMHSIGVQAKKKCLECKLWSKKVQSLEKVLAKVAKQIGKAKKQLEEEENE